MPHVDLQLSDRSYRVAIEPGALRRVGSIAREHAPSPRCAVLVDDAVAGTHGATAIDALRAAGFEPLVHELRASEKEKSLEATTGAYRAMLAAGLDRKCPVIAVGGGIVGDVAGFVAATYLRGVPFIQIPTTLLAMVDASVGGKTGVNFPLPGSPGEPDVGAAADAALGKNLIGAFWQPRAVVIDPETLRTLPERHLRCGLAECVKHGILRDASLFDFIDANAAAILALEQQVLTTLIERSVAIKARIVEADEREAGVRALLNLGHTFAHAIEPIVELDLHHGEAVAIGMVAAARCALHAGSIDAGDVDRIARLLASLQLPTRLPKPVDAHGLLRAMTYDKKTEGGRFRLILPEMIGRARIAEDVPANLIVHAWRDAGASADDTASSVETSGG
jgi:3-dehydroquinate synthase